MSKVAITGNASGTGTFTVAAPNSNTDRTLTLPDESGTVLTTAGGYLLGGITYLTSGTSATYTTPTGVRALYVEVVGGGGGGGGIQGSATASTGAGGGGGGGGGYVAKLITTPSASYTYTVGAGGAGGAAGANNGTSGSGSVFTDGNLLLQGQGGAGGQGLTAGAGNANYAPANGGGEQSGSTGDIVIEGTPGGPRTRGNFVQYVGGNGGSSYLGSGPRGEQITNNSVAGNNATNYGAGGSGAANEESNTTAAGGNGYQGVIRITEYY